MRDHNQCDTEETMNTIDTFKTILRNHSNLASNWAKLLYNTFSDSILKNYSSTILNNKITTAEVHKIANKAANNFMVDMFDIQILFTKEIDDLKKAIANDPDYAHFWHDKLTKAVFASLPQDSKHLMLATAVACEYMSVNFDIDL